MSETNPSYPTHETTEVLYGNDNIQRRVIEAYSWIKEGIDGVVDHTQLAMHVEAGKIRDFHIQLRKKGVSIRMVTEVTSENINYAKDLMEAIEIRHMPGVKGNFGVVDKRVCLLHSISTEDQPLTHAILTNAKALVEAQQFLFDTLWNQAIPVQERILEIEEHMKPPFIETIRDPYEIQKLFLALLDSAKQEILILLFPPTTANNLLSQFSGKLIKLLESARNRIRVKILTSENIRNQIEKLIAQKNEGRGKQGKIEIHLIDTLKQQRLQTKVSFLVIDSKVSLVEEPIKSNKNGALALATYSNSDSIVLTYISIFEKLWAETELEINQFRM